MITFTEAANKCSEFGEPHHEPGYVMYATNKFNSRVTFKAQLKVGWQPKYYIKCYIPKCWSYPEVYESARSKWLLLVRAEKSKMASKMAAKNKCKGVLYMISCTYLMHFNTSY